MNSIELLALPTEALLWSGLAVIVCLISLKLSVYIHGTAFSPLGMYAAAWGTLVGLYLIQGIVGFNFISVRPLAWFIVISTVSVFAIGSVIGAGLSSRYRDNTAESSLTLNHVPHKLPPVIYIFIGIGAVGIAIKWGILLDMYGTIPRAISNVNVVRARAIRGEFSYPTIARILVLFLFPSLLFSTLLSRKKSRYLVVVFGILFLLFLDDLSIAARGHTAFGFSIVAATYLVTVVTDPNGSLRNNIKLMCGAIILALLSINLIFAIRTGFDGGVISYILASFKSIYRYAVGPLPAFSWILPQQSLSRYPGAYTFGGLYRIINYLLEPILATKPFPRPVKPDAKIPLGFNTFPHLWAFYSDFGLAGTFGLLCGFGILTSYIYSRFLVEPTLLNHMIISNTLIFIAWTPRDVTTFWVSYWVTLLVSSVIAYFIDNRKSWISD